MVVRRSTYLEFSEFSMVSRILTRVEFKYLSWIVAEIMKAVGNHIAVRDAGQLGFSGVVGTRFMVLTRRKRQEDRQQGL